MNLHDPLPNVQQWSLVIQHDFGSGWTSEIDYVGTKSTHLDVLSDYNQPLIENNISTGVAPFANFGWSSTPTLSGMGTTTAFRPA